MNSFAHAFFYMPSPRSAPYGSRAENALLLMCARSLVQFKVTGLTRVSPASVPCAQTISTPTAIALWTCFVDPTMFMTGIPASWSRATAHAGGTPTAHTNSFAPSGQSRIRRCTYHITTGQQDNRTTGAKRATSSPPGRSDAECKVSGTITTGPAATSRFCQQGQYWV